MSHRILCLAILCSPLSLAARAADEFPILFQEDFEKDASHWQPLDAKQWAHKKTDKGSVYSQHHKETTYKPPYRSPTNVSPSCSQEWPQFSYQLNILKSIL